MALQASWPRLVRALTGLAGARETAEDALQDALEEHDNLPREIGWETGWSLVGPRCRVTRKIAPPRRRLSARKHPTFVL